ncbi:MAG: CpaF family protein [Chloroflexi bacterium]|nr:CpaF family protein [Chloroflexota bacterium]
MPGLLDRVASDKSKGEAPTADKPAPTLPEVETKFRQWVIEKLLAEIGNAERLTRSDAVVSAVRERFVAICKAANAPFTPKQLDSIEHQVLDEILGFGPIEPLLQDPSITEVMVNGPHHVFAEQKGRVAETDIHFDDDAHVYRVIERILRPLGRRVNRQWPLADARLPDGSRVNVIIPPSAIDGPTITIRKFSKKKLMATDLIAFGSMSQAMADLLQACVVARLNIIVSGGTGSGKTTLLNVLSNFIPDHERIVTVEDSAELQLAKPHIVRLEAHPGEPDGSGKVTIRDLVVNSLRMRPERIVVGEVRDGAALDMLQAMNTGHDGSLTTLHANTPRDAISRLETMTLMAGIEFPIRVIREQIVHAIDLIVQQARLRDGSRKITQITEVLGMEGDTVVMQDVFRFVEKGVDGQGAIIGEMKPTGIRPRFVTRLEAVGFSLPPETFGVEPLTPRKK